jgi:hypothetical protein
MVLAPFAIKFFRGWSAYAMEGLILGVREDLPALCRQVAKAVLDVICVFEELHAWPACWAAAVLRYALGDAGEINAADVDLAVLPQQGADADIGSILFQGRCGNALRSKAFRVLIASVQRHPDLGNLCGSSGWLCGATASPD